ncbi:MAG: TatD family hydrolase [Bdellovibrionota bacterium]|nr:TatD family hydrolase [Bdellovibrionota bacterium]|tara:strand:+ start:8131 stop:8988 length:858 start_codon:yes stop_codon:yes gene_type:complete
MGKKRDYFETLGKLEIMEEGENKTPSSKYPLFETHCHLDYLKENELNKVIHLSKDVGIKKIVTISVSPSNFKDVHKLCQTDDMIYGTQGVHPHEAKDWNQSICQEVKKDLSNTDKIVAIGEIGLDYYYNHSSQTDQRTAFEEQLQLASELDLPVVIHSRDAEDDTIAILKNFSSSLKKKGVIHSFTSKLALAKFALSEGLFLGFNGIVTFKNAHDVREALEICPTDRILIETDSPFLTPTPHRGKENTPFYLPFIAQYISDFKKEKPEILLPKVYQNSLKFFQID